MALKLFAEKGFEHTPISEIVKSVGVAQGTFYYYFKSKDDLLNSMVSKLIDGLIKEIKQITTTESLNPAQKLLAILKSFADLTTDNDGLMDYFHSSKNIIIHQKFEDLTLKEILPYILEIIQDGNKIGMFNCPYPKETILILIAGISKFFHDKLLSKNTDFSFNDLFPVIQYCFVRMLGTKEDVFKIYFE